MNNRYLRLFNILNLGFFYIFYLRLFNIFNLRLARQDGRRLAGKERGRYFGRGALHPTHRQSPSRRFVNEEFLQNVGDGVVGEADKVLWNGCRHRDSRHGKAGRRESRRQDGARLTPTVFLLAWPFGSGCHPPACVAATARIPSRRISRSSRCRRTPCPIHKKRAHFPFHALSRSPSKGLCEYTEKENAPP